MLAASQKQAGRKGRDGYSLEGVNITREIYAQTFCLRALLTVPCARQLALSQKATVSLG